jgi:hypothetical protein
MSKLAIASLLVFLVGGQASAAGKQSDRWMVTQLTGEARVIHPGLQSASLKVNAEVAPGDTLVTGNSGHATLVHGRDYILVAPNSELKLPTGAQPSGFTRVIERLGSILFKVEHTAIPHFAVETPMLAAVVKGTTFNVVVDEQRTSVEVIQGVVQVSAFQGGMTRLVEGGGIVAVEPRNPATLFDVDKPAAAPPPSGIKVAASGWTDTGSVSKLTGGLISTETATRPILVTTELLAAVEPPASASVAVAASVPVNLSVSPSASGGNSASVHAPVAGSVTITTPSATTPSVSAPSVTTPAVSVPSVSIPSTAVPHVTTPGVTVPAVTVPVVTTPAVTVPAVTVPAVTMPTVTVPAITVPPVTTPVVSIPAVTVPPVTVPPITLPSIPLLGH